MIDFHVHVFPEPGILKKLDPALTGTIKNVRRQGRKLMQALPRSLHGFQSLVRWAPEKIRNALDEVGAVATLPHLLLEATPEDLEEAMRQSQIEYAVVLGQPPYTPNEFLLEEARRNPKLIPFMNVPPGTPEPGKILKKYVKDGARGLKIHASIDGIPLDSGHYRSLLDAASDEGLPVILHTGCIHMSLFYKNPGQSEVQNFEPWFRKYPQTTFILAHMNFHDPDRALEMMSRYENLKADISWQPAETIARAAGQVGAERLLFATDWPLGGQNMAVGLERLQKSVEAGALTREQADLIGGRNALKLLKLKSEI